MGGRGVRGRARVSGSTDPDAQEYFQLRLAMFSKLVFWTYLPLQLLVQVAYWWNSSVRPEAAVKILIGDLVFLVTVGAIWRIALVRRPITMRLLEGVDLLYAGMAGTVLALSGWWKPDMRAAPYLLVIYAYWIVFARALVVPTTARRTAIVSTTLFVPIVIAGILFAPNNLDFAPVVFAGGCISFSVVAILLASAGSRIIYGLRREVRAAMQLGRYTLERKIGEGGMGIVYSAKHALLRRPTAIKLLTPEKMGTGGSARFEREVQHMASLTHPNTAAVYDYGHSADGAFFYYAMEYLGGGVDLEQLVRHHGVQPAGRVVKILVQVCGAIQEAHDRGIIHRDIKPANIILCERGGMLDFVKVVDFGLVKEIDQDKATSTTQAILGTPAYIAPEAVTDPASIGPPVDIYAIGAVAYYLLAGKAVFDGATPMAVCIQQATATPKPLSEITTNAIPQELETLVLACLAKSPSDRPASASALAAALRAMHVDAWSDDDAAAWWKRFASIEQLKTTSDGTPTRTLSIARDRLAFDETLEDEERDAS
jgi:eukaryotic-like serine/threonine-protein kinase